MVTHACPFRTILLVNISDGINFPKFCLPVIYEIRSAFIYETLYLLLHFTVCFKTE